MIPKTTQIDTSRIDQGLKLVGLPEVPPAGVVPSRAEESTTSPSPMDRLRPELRKAAEESWKQNEAAYRYLGR